MESGLTLSWAVWLAAGAVIFAAGLTQGALGLGFPTISAPVLAMVLLWQGSRYFLPAL